MQKKLFQLFSKNSDFFKFIFLLVAGTLAWSLTMVKSGLLYPFGMGFWGPNGHDGIWHVALINSLAKGLGGMPVFAGEVLKNYHLGFDLLVAFLHKVTHLSVLNLYFQKLPPVMAIVIGILTYKFVLDWKKSRESAFWAMFFVYFGGGFGWLLKLLQKQGLSGESLFWAQGAISTLINPPFALSLIFILLGLIFLIKLRAKFSWLNFIFAVLFFGLTIEIKVYAGLLVLAGLFLAGLKEKKLFAVFGGSLILATLLYFIFNRSSASLVVFQPFWFLETMMGLSDRVNWPRFYSAMVNYRSGGIWLKAVLAYLFAFAVFYAGNMGTRIISLFLVYKRLKNIKTADFIELFMFGAILLGVLIPTFFLQKGTPWNTIQFFYYSLFFAGILGGVALGEFIKTERLNTSLIYIIEVFVILLTIPTAIGTLKEVYLPSRPPAKLSYEELKALSFLAGQKEGIILTYPFDREKAKEAENSPPRPLYLYESTAYVSALTNKPVFLEDEVNLDITGYDWRTRRKEIKEFYASLDHKLVRDFLRKNNINYVYWLKGQRATLGEGQLGLSRIFENSEVDIYKVE